ncbi:hypothetical protein [Leptothrix ochracea]
MRSNYISTPPADLRDAAYRAGDASLSRHRKSDGPLQSTSWINF